MSLAQQVCQVCLSRAASIACFIPSPNATPHYCRLLNKFLSEEGKNDENKEKSRTFVVCLATVNGVLTTGVPLRSAGGDKRHAAEAASRASDDMQRRMTWRVGSVKRKGTVARHQRGHWETCES